MRKWVVGFIGSIVILIIIVIVDSADPSENVLKDTKNMVYEQMTQKQQQAMKIETIYKLLEVSFSISAVVSIGGMIYEIIYKFRQD